MIMHQDFESAILDILTQRAGMRVWYSIVRNSERGNILLGATIPRLMKLCRAGRAVIESNLRRMEEHNFIRYDREKLVIYLNPYAYWNGATFHDDQHRTALREWDNIPRDEKLYEYVQRELLWPENGSAGYGVKPFAPSLVAAGDGPVIVRQFSYQPDEPAGYQKWKRGMEKCADAHEDD